MKAVDTNILARFFIDDPDDAESARQRPLAVGVMEKPVFVPVTVLLEFEWVMRGFYRLERADILRIMQTLGGFSHVVLEDRALVQQALDHYAAGLDFADALHLTRSGHCQALVTFDVRFAKKAKGLGGVVEIPG